MVNDIKLALMEEIKNLLSKTNGKVYGDNFIGYRIQDNNGKYLDDELGEIYELFDNCELFNEVCFELRSGDYNWSKN